MRFCEDHWQRIREEVKRQGMADLISPSGKVAATRDVANLTNQGRRTLATFDPLMGAHWGIVTNVFDYLRRAGGDPLYILTANNEADESHTSRSSFTEEDGGHYCPLCEIGLLHEDSCNDPRCTLPKKDGYAWMIERAVSEEKKTWERLRREAAA